MKHQLFRLLVSVLVTSSLIGAGCGQIGPAADPLPLVADIRSMNARYYDRDEKHMVKFEVPQNHRGKILDALRPATYDSNPAKWVVLGQLDIERRDNRPFKIQLYSVRHGDGRDEAGAFSAGETYDQRSYYRGGTTPKLEAALKAAYKASGGTGRPVAPTDPF
jgi:hypothetical protein